MIRQMTVAYAGDNGRKPMIRIANNFLLSYGFVVGSKFYVEYQDDRIIIKNKI